MSRIPLFLQLPILIGILVLAAFVLKGVVSSSQPAASAAFMESLRTMDLQATYDQTPYDATKKVRILVVPGHDQDFSGTRFLGTNELELNLLLGGYLAEMLSREDAFEVILSQDARGYLSDLTRFFTDNRAAIQKFIGDNHGVMHFLRTNGAVADHHGVEHVTAPDPVVHRLYGINAWANNSGIDIVIHIHFNDDPRRHFNRAGAYTGFTVYAPETQYSNSRASTELAEAIAAELNKRSAISDHPKEKAGVVPDQDLIAIGANNTLEAAGILVEYGYIYEPQVIDETLRPLMLRELALQTAKGVLDFFHDDAARNALPETTLLPHVWKGDLTYGMRRNGDVLALQAALMREGIYPPPALSVNTCPFTGAFLPCTRRAVEAFQKKYGLPATGYVGERTRKVLNERYGH